MFANRGDILQFCITDCSLINQNRELKYSFVKCLDDVFDPIDTLEAEYININRRVERDFHRFNVIFSEYNNLKKTIVSTDNKVYYKNRPFSTLFGYSDEN